MSSSDQYNILGSSKLNTADGKNPPVSGSGQAQSKDSAQVQPGNTEDKSHGKSAHDALEDRLREEERLARRSPNSKRVFVEQPLTCRHRLEKRIVAEGGGGSKSRCTMSYGHPGS